MNVPSANLLVAVGNGMACVKIIGRANFTSSVDFKRLIQELQQRGYSKLVLDLSECLLMDSTFLGVLAGLGLRMSNGNPLDEEPRIEMLNPNPRITDLLVNLGVAHLFRIISNNHPNADRFASQYIAITPSREEISRTSLEAHRTLMDINPANVPKFKDVTEFLAESLKK
jgi:anti-sigma B factor antagonist